MRSSIRFAAIAALALVPALALADDSYTFKLPKPVAAGDRAQINNVAKTDTEFSVVDGGGQVLNSKTEKKSYTATGVETVVTKEKGKKASKLTVTYEKAILSIDGKDLDTGLAGKTVTVQREGKKVSFKLEDGTEPAEAALKFLQEHYKGGNEREDLFEETIFPKEPVKVGESWSANLEEMVKQIGGGESSLEIDLKKSTGSCKLLKVFAKDGRQFAAIDVDVKLAIKQIGGGEQAIKLDAGSFFKFKGTGEVTIDGGPNGGAVAMKLDMSGTGKLSTPDGQQLNVKLSVKGTENNTHAPLPAK